VSLQVYDDFGTAGYSLTDYNEKWMTPNGLGEIAVEDTRSFSGGRSTRPDDHRAGRQVRHRQRARRGARLARPAPEVSATACAAIGENTQLKGDDMAFAMRDEWKEEPVSTTGAEYVEPSATELIKPGQRVSHLFPRAVMEEFVLQRVTERVWWVTRQFYGSLFYVGKRGVLLFDSPLGGADATLAAIASVTSLPVTAVVYSHFHADHVGGSRRLFELLAAAPPRVIASEHTATWMSRFGSDLPRPADVLDWPSGVVRFEDVTVRLAGFPFPCHAPDHAMFLIEEEHVGHTADVVNVDQLPFGGFGGQEPLVLLTANLEFIRSLGFDWFCGGHGNIGEKSDVDFYLNYLDDVAALVNEYVPRPTEVPDLSLTDYLAAGLDLETKSRLLSQLNNHFGLYEYGKQIVDGVKPLWDGVDPYQIGNIPEWTAARQQAVDEAVPKIIERLRPEYGRMYDFDDAQPFNVRLMAMDMQVTMSNR
jgi:glyoxylase-like metal-dependent hydrolase (beta-lactamase superfamily II)